MATSYLDEVKLGVGRQNTSETLNFQLSGIFFPNVFVLYFQGFKNKSKLFYIAYEILTTEKTFVEALTLICEVSLIIS